MQKNPFFSRSSVKARQLAQQLVEMAAQRPQAPMLTISVVSKDTLALGWEGILRKMAEKAVCIKLVGWTNDKGVVPTLILYPKVMLRYSKGRLSPNDTFGRRVMDILRVLSDPGKTQAKTQAMSRAFARAKTALENFSLEMAAQAGKTGRDHPALTLRMLDWVMPGQIRVNPATAEQASLRSGQVTWAMRHPLPTRVKVTVVLDVRVPEGCALMSPADCQEGPQADADGDQVLLLDDWEGSNPDPVCGPKQAHDGLQGLADTSLAGWLKPGKLKKLRFDGLLKVDAKAFGETVHQLAAYSVSGIGQVGYNPSLAMALLALVGDKAFKPMAVTGFRRLYEDMLLAGLTPERWQVFKVARDLRCAGPLHGTLKRGFEQIGLHFSDEQVRLFVIARAITMAASSLENGAESVSRKLVALMDGYEGYVKLYGLVRAIDAGRLDSVFLPQWQWILEGFDPELPLIKVLNEVCPILMAARGEREARQQRAEYAVTV